MKSLLERYLPLRAPAGDPPSAPPAPPAAPPATPPAGGPPAAPPATPPAGDPPATPPAGPYRPEGLDDSMFGKDNNETIDKLQKAVKGYRDRDATRVVPDKPEAYAAIDADKLVGDMKLDASVKPFLQELANDPIMKAVGAYAIEHKLPVADVQGLVGTVFAEAQKSGLLEAAIDPVAERTALLPEAAKSLPKADQDKAIDARLKANEDFVKLLMQPGADGKAQLDKKVGENALLMLMDTAAGNQFLEFFAAKMTGGDRAQPLAGAGGVGAGGNNQREALKARAALPENTQGNPKFDRASYDALMADYRKLIP